MGIYFAALNFTRKEYIDPGDDIGDFCCWGDKHEWWKTLKEPGLRLMRKYWLPNENVWIVADAGYAFRAPWWLTLLQNPRWPEDYFTVKCFDEFYDVKDSREWRSLYEIHCGIRRLKSECL